MMRELSTTVSPGSIERFLWLSTATRESADIGSPWVPETTASSLLGRNVHDVLRPQQHAVRDVEQAERVRDFGRAHHAAAHETPPCGRYSAARSRICCRRWIEELKQEITSRRSARLNDLFEARPHGALALGVAGPVRVGRIRKQQQHAALAVIGQRVQVEQLVVGRASGPP